MSRKNDFERLQLEYGGFVRGNFMRLFFVVLPVAVLFAGAGGYMMYKASRYPTENVGIDFNQPAHLVTPPMEKDIAIRGLFREKSFSVSDERGKSVVVAPEDGKEPQFVLFIKDACPCSINAQPLFNKLATRFKGKVEFVGVIDADKSEAGHYASTYLSAFPVVPDNKLAIIHSYQAKGGVYSALLDRSGRLIKMWPGYSADLLREMNSQLALASGTKETIFDPEYAPTVKAAGCAYSW